MDPPTVVDSGERRYRLGRPVGDFRNMSNRPVSGCWRPFVPPVLVSSHRAPDTALVRRLPHRYSSRRPNRQRHCGYSWPVRLKSIPRGHCQHQHDRTRDWLCGDPGFRLPCYQVRLSATPHGQTLTRRSLLWRQLLQAQLNNQPPSRRDLAVPFVSHRIPFPDFDFLRNHVKRQSGNFTSSAEAIASMATYGPLLARLIAQGMLESPMFTITLQRDTVDIGGDIGLLSIGQLPPGISTSSLTWVPLRAYPAKDGGLPPPPEAPNEVRTSSDR